jgi:hypothetical protein
VSEKITFTEQGTFQALFAAERWCIQRGVSYGSLCGDEPVALLQGNHLIAKWRNLTGKEKGFIDGKMTSPDFREGPVTIEWFRAMPEVITQKETV